jgi:hypothetical protein
MTTIFKSFDAMTDAERITLEVNLAIARRIRAEAELELEMSEADRLLRQEFNIDEPEPRAPATAIPESE